jgi:uncharacterized BrkB/YihY/UPF0761 family membrane protein
MGPRLFATLFILGDFVCLSFIGVGGSCAAIFRESPVGVDLMIAGVGTQVLFTAIFCIVLWTIYRIARQRVSRHQGRYAMLGKSSGCYLM